MPDNNIHSLTHSRKGHNFEPPVISSIYNMNGSTSSLPQASPDKETPSGRLIVVRTALLRSFKLLYSPSTIYMLPFARGHAHMG
jgi:hypothetical protein